jgi:hypothetical protein
VVKNPRNSWRTAADSEVRAPMERSAFEIWELSKNRASPAEVSARRGIRQRDAPRGAALGTRGNLAREEVFVNVRVNGYGAKSEGRRAKTGAQPNGVLNGRPQAQSLMLVSPRPASPRRGQGLGKDPPRDAQVRTANAAGIAGLRAVVVDAKDGRKRCICAMGSSRFEMKRCAAADVEGCRGWVGECTLPPFPGAADGYVLARRDV